MKAKSRIRKSMSNRVKGAGGSARATIVKHSQMQKALDRYSLDKLCKLKQRISLKQTHYSYRDTEKSVPRHIGLDKPVHGLRAACMDIFVQPSGRHSNTAVFEYASVRVELFSAIYKLIKRIYDDDAAAC